MTAGHKPSRRLIRTDKKSDTHTYRWCCVGKMTLQKWSIQFAPTLKYFLIHCKPVNLTYTKAAGLHCKPMLSSAYLIDITMTHSLLLVQSVRDTSENLRLLQFNILTVCTYMCCSEANSANVVAILNMQMSQMSPIFVYVTPANLCIKMRAVI